MSALDEPVRIALCRPYARAESDIRPRDVLAALSPEQVDEALRVLMPRASETLRGEWTEISWEALDDAINDAQMVPSVRDVARGVDAICDGGPA